MATARRLSVQTILLSARCAHFPGLLEQSRRHVQAGDLRAGTRGGDGDDAGAGRDVQDVLTRGDSREFHEVRRHRRRERRRGGERHPQLPLALLEVCERI
jgi:hypothetical protein